MSFQGRAWCFTLNNWTDAEKEFLRGFTDVTYLCFQEEVAPQTLTPHLQGYIRFKKPVRLAWLKRNVLVRAHWEKAKGNDAQNKEYCAKAGGVNFFEFGTPSFQGKRNDIHVVTDMVARGVSIDEIAHEHPAAFVRYHKGIERLAATYIGKRDWKTEVYWFYGPTGTGKSRRAQWLAPEAYRKMGGNKWWDGYTGQEDVIIDDFRADLCPFHELLRLLDRYPHRVEYKGGSVSFVAKRVIITAPQHPRELFHGRTDEQVNQLLRRLEHIEPMLDGSWEPVAIAPIETFMDDFDVDMSIFDNLIE